MTNNMNINRNSVKNPTYGMSYITAGILFVLIFALCAALFGFVAFNADKNYEITNSASGMFLNVTCALAVVAAFVCAVILCVRCAKSNKLKNPDMFIPPRDTFYYFKRVGFFVLMIVLMNIAASFVGMCAIALFGGILMHINNLYFRELAIKLPVFILYLALVYKMLVRFGFMDSQRKIFNRNFKLITIIISSVIMLPAAVHDSFFAMPAVNSMMVNANTVFSPHVGVYIADDFDGFPTLNPNFSTLSVVLIVVTVLLTFAIQTGVFVFAYNRGKKVFIKQHIRQIDEYEMDENI